MSCYKARNFSNQLYQFRINTSRKQINDRNTCTKSHVNKNYRYVIIVKNKNKIDSCHLKLDFNQRRFTLRTCLWHKGSKLKTLFNYISIIKYDIHGLVSFRSSNTELIFLVQISFGQFIFAALNDKMCKVRQLRCVTINYE